MKTIKKVFDKSFIKIKVTVNIIIILILAYGIYKDNLYNIFFSNYNMKKILTVIIGIIVIYYISIFLHELGHFIMSKLVSIDLKLFVVGPFKFMKDKNKTIFKIRLSGALMSGGFILPEINNEVKDRTSLDVYKYKYIKILFGGPLFTFVIIVVSAILIIVSKFTIICICILILNWSIFINIFYSSAVVYGDYCLINLLKEKPESIVLMFANQLSAEYPINNFIVKQCEIFVEQVLEKGEYNRLLIPVINRIVDEKIVKGQDISNECMEFKAWIFNCYFNSSSKDLMLDAKIIKLAYKFLLHEYSLTKDKLKLDNYESFQNFLKTRNYDKAKYFSILSKSLKILFEEKNGFDDSYKIYICDAGQILSECDNYKKLVEDILKRLN